MSTEAVAGRVVVDRYELVETLGTGPMGPVWRAHDHRLQREVAIREVELPDVLDDAEQSALAEKVLREASAASRLDHPGAVTVLDVVTEDGRPFVVSELVMARTLAEVVATDGPLPSGQVALIGLRLLDALAAAHDIGLVHRDVRPSNVLLSDSGIRLADFGVASMVDDPRITVHEPSYLAPEQMESAGATALSDLWSLGATLYFAVEGEPPFDGESPAAVVAAIVSQAPHPARRAGGLQPVFDALLVKEAMDRPDDNATRVLLIAAADERGTAVATPVAPAEPPDHEVPEEPTAFDEPAFAEEPTAFEEPSAFEEPVAFEEPASVEEPIAVEEPASVEEPIAFEERAWVEEPDLAGGQADAADPGLPETPLDEDTADDAPADPLEWAATPVPPPGPIDDPAERDPVWARTSPVAVDDDEMWSALPSWATSARATSSSAGAVASPDPVGFPGATAPDGASADHDPAGGPLATRREPWFFQFPVETVPPPPLPEPPPRPAVSAEPERPPGRFPRGVWAALIAALIASVMIALIITGGHTLRAQRPTIETSKGPGAVSTWVPYTDATTGFTIRYPPSWSVRRTGTQTFFVDPAGISYLEVDHQQPPAASLVTSAFDQEKSFSAGHPTYKRINIEPGTYQDKPSSLWQFTYADGGTNIRAIDVGVNSPKYGFALFFQARADDWTRAQNTFESFKSVFGIPN